ncbi:nucleoside 2-deoxyribosyltransferase [Candidatus Saccharibacteria bacterium]|nr:nucleoside 2-deoxyribosyltransferase [Candidatus Saccharibacteria bacterium]
MTSRFKGSQENRAEIERLCLAVRDAGIEDFHFIRDVENFQPNFFKTQEELWENARNQIAKCDALLIDITDHPSGGRLIEAGIAYALDKPVYVIMKNDTIYKDFYTGIADAIFKYNSIEDVTDHLKSI